uniref:Galactose-3-O-sulfotransferase n=1 Tax=Amblyomma maculatum TaxID=34609 RepID=G3MR89_AMBMU
MRALFCSPLALRPYHIFAVPLLVVLCLLFRASTILKPFCNRTESYNRAWPTPNTSIPGPHCTPRSSVCLLKMHKCASTAVQNILMRYGERHGLTFALPHYDVNMGHPLFFNRTQAMGSPPFDMLVHHIRFQEAEVRAVLKPDAVYVTIVREPAALFESLFSYYNLEEQIGVKLEQLSSAVKNASLTEKIRGILPGPHRGGQGINQMSFDLGFDIEQVDNMSAIQTFLEHVDTVFDLVMVAERINESLVLLRHLLCWDMDDVVVFRLNARQEHFRRPMKATLADELRSLNAADTMLYAYFVRRFEQRVQAFGRERLQKELTLLEQRTQFWYRRCVEQEVPADKRKKNVFSEKVLTLQLRDEDDPVCYRMTEVETLFTKQLRFRQLRDWYRRRHSSRSSLNPARRAESSIP